MNLSVLNETNEVKCPQCGHRFAPNHQHSSAQPSGAPGTDFPAYFNRVFTTLDRSRGGHNFVSLVDLRQQLPAYDQTTFNAELHKLRRAGQFTLSGAEGRHGISATERAAGIIEDGTLLLYVSRRY